LIKARFIVKICAFYLMCLFQEFGSTRTLELLLLCMADQRFAVILYDAYLQCLTVKVIGLLNSICPSHFMTILAIFCK